MHARKPLALVLCGAVALTIFSGCMTQNNVVSAALKVASGQMTTLTPTELQLVSDFILEQPGVVAALQAKGVTNLAPLSAEEAQVATEFIQQYNLNTIADVQNLINNPGQIQITAEQLAVLERLAAGRIEDFQAVK
jgi:hypothetical protein